MKTLISTIIAGGKPSHFDTYYDSAKVLFKSHGHFHALTSKTCKGLLWPRNNGIYVVWETSSEEKALYIGMTGKFSQDGEISGPGLKGRRNRWTPYRFDEHADTFCFGPKYTKGESKQNGPPKDGYSHNIPISNIRVDCFEYFTAQKMAPTFLEALFLQGYLMQYGSLPVANNKF